VFILNNKKGISPLIATVLIIGFTIVVAVLVITWISSLTDDTQTQQACTADALNSCTDAIRFLSFSAVPGTASGDIDVRASNTGPGEYVVKAIVLDSTGAMQGTAHVLETTANNGVVEAYSDASKTIALTAGTAYDIRFIVEVNGTYKDTVCTETCGDGETKTGVVATT
jgi:flagellin-like protein